jgi:hypothetical protein
VVKYFFYEEVEDVKESIPLRYFYNLLFGEGYEIVLTILTAFKPYGFG